MPRTHGEIINIIKNAHEQIQADNNTLKVAYKSLGDNLFLSARRYVKKYCKYTQALTTLDFSALNNAILVAVFNKSITFEDVEFCRKRVEEQPEEKEQLRRDLEYLGLKESYIKERNLTHYNIHRQAETKRGYELERQFEIRRAEQKAKDKAEYEKAKAEWEKIQAEQRRIAEQEKQATIARVAKARAEQEKKVDLFREKPIKWGIQPKYKTDFVKTPFSTELEEQTIFVGENHFIKYDKQEYTREEFYQSQFKDYKKHPYRTKFLTDNIFWLGSSRRAWYEYHILAKHFELVEVDEQDKEDQTCPQTLQLCYNPHKPSLI